MSYIQRDIHTLGQRDKHTYKNIHIYNIEIQKYIHTYTPTDTHLFLYLPKRIWDIRNLGISQSVLGLCVPLWTLASLFDSTLHLSSCLASRLAFCVFQWRRGVWFLVPGASMPGASALVGGRNPPLNLLRLAFAFCICILRYAFAFYIYILPLHVTCAFACCPRINHLLLLNTYIHTYIHTYMTLHTYIHYIHKPDKHTYAHTYIQTRLQTDIQSDRQSDIQTDRQANEHTYIQTYNQTGRHTYRHTIHT